MGRARQFDEDDVLRSVRDQFWATGYAGTGMDAISAATGLGKGSLYGAFGDKRALFGRIFDSYCHDIVTVTRRKLSGPDNRAMERLSTQVRGVASQTAADTRHRGCLLAKGTAELAEHDPAVLARGRQTLAALLEALAADLTAAQRNGDLDPSTDPTALAGVLLAVERGIEALGKAGVDPAHLETIAATTMALIAEREPADRNRPPVS